MINFPKTGSLANFYKVTSYVNSSAAPVVSSTIKSNAVIADVPFIPFTSNGFNKNLSSNSVKVISGISGKTQYRYAHTDLQLPDYTNVRVKQTRDPNVKTSDSADARKAYSYFVTTLGLTGAAYLSKEVITKTALYLHFSQDAYAIESVEIDISSVPEGKSVTFKWQGKPLFVKHRTAEEIEDAANTSIEGLRDPQEDSARVKNPKWLITLGICTHLGCIPIPNKGDFKGGYFCPCHGSHYDSSGRARKGPAPLNLEVPRYEFTSDTVIRVG